MQTGALIHILVVLRNRGGGQETAITDPKFNQIIGRPLNVDQLRGHPVVVHVVTDAKIPKMAR